MDTSGLRGIGRAISDLLVGLDAVDRADLDVRAVLDLDADGEIVVTADLRAAAEVMGATRGTQIDEIAPKRRRFLGRAARRAGASLLHLTEPRGMSFGPRPPTLVTWYDLIPLNLHREYLSGFFARERRAFLERSRYLRADRIVACSRRTREDLIHLVLADPERVDVVPIGIDLALFARDGAAPPPPAVPYVLYVGYCDPRKNVETMFDAVARLQRPDRPIDFVWAGALLPEDVARLRTLAASKGLGSRLQLLGFVDDARLRELYHAAAAHLFVSRLEGFGISVVEALAAACPVVVARDSGADELGADAAITVPAGDVEATARSLETLLDPRERARRVQLGLERAITFDRRTMARGYLSSYRRVIQRPSDPR